MTWIVWFLWFNINFLPTVRHGNVEYNSQQACLADLEHYKTKGYKLGNFVTAWCDPFEEDRMY